MNHPRKSSGFVAYGLAVKLATLVTLGIAASALSGCGCIMFCQPKCTHDCHQGGLSLAVTQATDSVGISPAFLKNPEAIVVTFTTQLSATTTANLSAADIEEFDPSEVTAQVTVQEGTLAGSSGIAVIKVLDANNKVLTTYQSPYGISGDTIYLKNPDAITTWITNHAQGLLNEGGQKIIVTANLPILKAHNAAEAGVSVTLSYDGVAGGMVRGSFAASQLSQ